MAGAETGAPFSAARGCANSYLCLTSSELWPVSAKTWFQLYEKFFWQQQFDFASFREFPKDISNADWTIDVEANAALAGRLLTARLA